MEDKKQKITELLLEMAQLHPNERFGQLFFNYVCRWCPNQDSFFIEDDKLIDILQLQIDCINTQEFPTVKERKMFWLSLSEKRRDNVLQNLARTNQDKEFLKYIGIFEKNC